MTSTNPMIELCTLMLEQHLTSDAFAEWVTRHYGDPRALKLQDIEAIVEDFDRCVSAPPIELSEDDFAEGRAN